ncbi:MAG: HAMP domain-containing sensor histidine kinase [bacterium]|nr:HAMP domain-containing sensor histidine kinase [bacterium]
MKKPQSKIEENDLSKTDFIYVVSHELRSPLATVKNAIEILFDGMAGEITDTQKHLLEIANKNINRLNFIIEDILDISRIDSGQIRIEFAPVDIKEVINDVVIMLEREANEKGISIEKVLPEKIIKVNGDFQRIIQILTNIIGNAIKFTNKGSITITATEEKEYVKISVKDTGAGIPPENIDKIFDKFFQIRESTSLSSKGVGLGLTITKKLVTMHNGKIEVESELNKGSTFSVFLPVG